MAGQRVPERAVRKGPPVPVSETRRTPDLVPTRAGVDRSSPPVSVPNKTHRAVDPVVTSPQGNRPAARPVEVGVTARRVADPVATTPSGQRRAAGPAVTSRKSLGIEPKPPRLADGILTFGQLG